MTAECDLLSDENDKVKLQITDPSASTSLSVSRVKKLSNNADSIGSVADRYSEVLEKLQLNFRLKILIYLHVTINHLENRF